MSPRLLAVILPWLLSAIWQATLTPITQAELALVSQGRSHYVIHHAADAPYSVRQGAAELQRVIKLATGATLPIVHEPGPRMIALGDSPVAAQAGLRGLDLPVEGYRIQAKGPTLFIVGHDSQDGQRLWAEGGTSYGTLYGVYDFLERHLGVRWLMPGPDGEDVPETDTLTLPATLDHPFAPQFKYRQIGDNTLLPEIEAWHESHRLLIYRAQRGSPVFHRFSAHMGHNTLPREVFDQHPQFAAMLHGKRIKPGASTFKLCGSADGLAELYAHHAQAMADRLSGKSASSSDWRYRVLSLTPSDGGGFCQCDSCLATEERTDPAQWPGNAVYGHRSRTPEVMAFYRKVATLIAKDRPDVVFSGLVYAQYAYPPKQRVALPDNVYLALAPRAWYGFNLSNPAYRREVAPLIQAWDRLYPGKMAYYDYALGVTGDYDYTGAPKPPGIAICRQIFAALAESQFHGALFSAPIRVWGVEAVNAYVIAKMLWNPHGDPQALHDEWLDRAYGQQAAKPMRELFALLDNAYISLKSTSEYPEWRFNEATLGIYIRHFDTIESLYRQAQAQPMTPAQRRRLAMFGDNLTLLHWHLKAGKRLADTHTSSFQLDDEAFTRFAASRFNQIHMPMPPHTQPPTLERFLTPRISTDALRRQGKIAHTKAKPFNSADNAAWESAPREHIFHRLEDQDRRTNAVMQAVHDGQTLHWRFMLRTQGSAGKEQVRIILGPPVSRENEMENLYPTHTWEIIVDAIGQWTTLANGVKATTPGIQAITSRQGQSMDVRVSLPLASLRQHLSFEGTMRGNILYRVVEAGRHERTYTWNPVLPGLSFTEPAGFGILTLE